MFKKKLSHYSKYLSFFILFWFYYSNSYLCSLALFNKDNSHILTIGVCHNSQNLNENIFLYSFFKDLNKLNKKITIIIEGTGESFISNCLFLDLAKTKDLCGFIKFIVYDSRSLKLRLFLKNYRLWTKAKNLLDMISLNESNNNFFKDLNNLDFDQAISEIEDNLEKIKLTITKNNFSNNFINNLKIKIENCFDDFKKNLDKFKSFSDINKILDFIEIIELDLADLNFILEILNYENDNLIIITGNDHTININNFLKNKSYKLAIPSIGLTSYITNNTYPICLNQIDIESKFNEILKIRF